MPDLDPTYAETIEPGTTALSGLNLNNTATSDMARAAMVFYNPKVKEQREKLTEAAKNAPPPDLDETAKRITGAIGAWESRGQKEEDSYGQGNTNALGTMGRWQFTPDTFYSDYSKYYNNGQPVPEADKPALRKRFLSDPQFQYDLAYKRTRDHLEQNLSKTGNIDSAIRDTLYDHYGHNNGNYDKPAYSRKLGRNVGESPNDYVRSVLGVMQQGTGYTANFPTTEAPKQVYENHDRANALAAYRASYEEAKKKSPDGIVVFGANGEFLDSEGRPLGVKLTMPSQEEPIPAPQRETTYTAPPAPEPLPEVDQREITPTETAIDTTGTGLAKGTAFDPILAAADAVTVPKPKVTDDAIRSQQVQSVLQKYAGVFAPNLLKDPNSPISEDTKARKAAEMVLSGDEPDLETAKAKLAPYSASDILGESPEIQEKKGKKDQNIILSSIADAFSRVRHMQPAALLTKAASVEGPVGEATKAGVTAASIAANPFNIISSVGKDQYDAIQRVMSPQTKAGKFIAEQSGGLAKMLEELWVAGNVTGGYGGEGAKFALATGIGNVFPVAMGQKTGEQALEEMTTSGVIGGMFPAAASKAGAIAEAFAGGPIRQRITKGIAEGIGGATIGVTGEAVSSSLQGRIPTEEEATQGAVGLGALGLVGGLASKGNPLEGTPHTAFSEGKYVTDEPIVEEPYVSKRPEYAGKMRRGVWIDDPDASIGTSIVGSKGLLHRDGKSFIPEKNIARPETKEGPIPTLTDVRSEMPGIPAYYSDLNGKPHIAVEADMLAELEEPKKAAKKLEEMGFEKKGQSYVYEYAPDAIPEDFSGKAVKGDYTKGTDAETWGLRSEARFAVGETVLPIDAEGNLTTPEPVRVEDIQVKDGQRYYKVEGTNTYLPEDRIESINDLQPTTEGATNATGTGVERENQAVELQGDNVELQPNGENRQRNAEEQGARDQNSMGGGLQQGEREVGDVPPIETVAAAPSGETIATLGMEGRAPAEGVDQGEKTNVETRADVARTAPAEEGRSNVSELAANQPGGQNVYERPREGAAGEQGDLFQSGAAGGPTGTLRAEVFPGVERVAKEVGSVLEKDVWEKTKKFYEGLVDATSRAYDTLNPGSHGRSSALALRGAMGKMRRNFEMADHASKTIREYFDKNSPAENLDFIHRMESGEKFTDPSEQRAAESIRGLLDVAEKLYQKAYPGKLKNLVANYFPHNANLFVNEGDAATYRSIQSRKRPLAGSKSPLKARARVEGEEAFADRSTKYTNLGDVVDAAQKHGLKLISDNPMELALAHYGQAQRAFQFKMAVNAMKRTGYAVFVRAGKKVPDGYKIVEDPAFRTFERIPAGEGEKKITVAGSWAIPSEGARVVNNYLSPGYGSAKWYQSLRGVTNMMNSVQLSLSAFHAQFTGINTLASQMALGLKQLKRGEIGEAAKSFISIPKAPISYYINGKKFAAAYLDPMKDPQLAPALKAFEAAGGSITPDHAQLTHVRDKMKMLWREGEYGRAIIRAPLAAMEYSLVPLMEKYIPAVKAGVFSQNIADYLRSHPEASEREINEYGAKLADNIDNVFGLVNYENIFLDKRLKDLAMIGVRSVGWNYGSLRQFGGAAKDIVQLAKNKGKGDLSDRIAYTASLPIIVGTLGAMTQMALTAINTGTPQFPSHDTMGDFFMDVFFPRTGKTDEHGNPERIALASYMKDLWHVFGSLSRRDVPLDMAINKLNPVWGTLGDIARNADFYGTQVINEDDIWYQQGLELMGYVGKQFTPFTYRNLEKSAKLEGKVTPEAFAQLFGFAPAPRDIVKSSFVRSLDEIAGEKMKAGGGDTKEEAERRFEKHAIRRQWQLGNEQEAVTRAKEDLKAGKITEKDLTDIERDISQTTMERKVKHLSAGELMKAYPKATDDEAAQVLPMIMDKIERADLDKLLPEEKDRLIKQVQEFDWKHELQRLEPHIKKYYTPEAIQKMHELVGE